MNGNVLSVYLEVAGIFNGKYPRQLVCGICMEHVRDGLYFCEERKESVSPDPYEVEDIGIPDTEIVYHEQCLKEEYNLEPDEALMPIIREEYEMMREAVRGRFKDALVPYRSLVGQVVNYKAQFFHVVRFERGRQVKSAKKI